MRELFRKRVEILGHPLQFNNYCQIYEFLKMKIKRTSLNRIVKSTDPRHTIKDYEN